MIQHHRRGREAVSGRGLPERDVSPVRGDAAGRERGAVPAAPPLVRCPGAQGAALSGRARAGAAERGQRPLGKFLNAAGREDDCACRSVSTREPGGISGLKVLIFRSRPPPPVFACEAHRPCGSYRMYGQVSSEPVKVKMGSSFGSGTQRRLKCRTS